LLCAALEGEHSKLQSQGGRDGREPYFSSKSTWTVQGYLSSRLLAASCFPEVQGTLEEG